MAISGSHLPGLLLERWPGRERLPRPETPAKGHGARESRFPAAVRQPTGPHHIQAIGGPNHSLSGKLFSFNNLKDSVALGRTRVKQALGTAPND